MSGTNILSRTLKIIVLILALALFFVSANKVFTYFREAKAVRDMTEELTDKAITVNESYEQIQSSDSENSTVTVKETAPISVNFDVLHEESESIIAWIYLPGTVINYPIVQWTDNSYYLNKLPGGIWNVNGSLFMDYRNASDFSDFNSVVYGHNMDNDSMFGILTDYKKAGFYEEHPVFYLLTPEFDYKVEIFAGFVTPADSDVYTVPEATEDRQTYIDNCIKQSNFVTEIKPDIGDRIITLSTCTYDYSDARYVIIGVMREL